MARPSTSMFDLSGSKLRKKLGASLQESAAAPPSDFARKQLEKLGWTEGTGLGKRRDGIATHIRVTKRKEHSGLGVEKAAAEERAAGEQWWKDSLGDTLAKLGKKKKKGSSSKKRKKVFTDEELFEATGGARFGMRAAPTQKLAKWRRTEASGELNGRPISPEETTDSGGDQVESATADSESKSDRASKSKKKSKKEKKDKKEKKEKKKRKREE